MDHKEHRLYLELLNWKNMKCYIVEVNKTEINES